MKISKKQRTANRQDIIRCAVALIIEKGIKSTTMRAIAQQAGLADATIYNYFPTKEALIYAYYEEHFTQCAKALTAICDFSDFTLHEKIQSLYQTSLDLYLRDREFIACTFKSVFFSFSQDYQRLKPSRDLFIQLIYDMVIQAVNNKEIPAQVFQDLLIQFFWDHYITMVLYWIEDGSDNFSNTTVMIDKSLDLACAALRAGIANKIFDLLIFLFKNHVLSRMDFLRQQIDLFTSLKKGFRSNHDAGENSKR